MRNTILICANVYPPDFIGGAELIAHYQAKALQRAGHEVIIYTGDIAEGPARYDLRHDVYDGLPVYRVHLVGPDYQNDYVNFFHPEVEKQFRGLLEKHAPDVVHLHNIIGLSAGIIHAAKQSGARTVLTLHDHWGFCFKNTIIKRHNEICDDFYRCHECMLAIHDGADRNIPIRMRNDYIGLLFDEVDCLVSPSLYLAEQYVRAGFAVGKMRVIWNGIDLERFSRVPKTPRRGPVRFTYIGYMGAHKGVGTIIEALPLLGASGQFHVNFVGAGDLTESLNRRAQELGYGSSVSFLGKVPNERIEDVFANTDVQLLPSIWPENQPVSVTEAMATGTPVIASRAGGAAELVADGLTGYLFDPGNPRDLAAKMALFLTNPERIATLGACGFQRIAENSFDRQVAKLLRLYNTSPVPRALAAVRPLIVCTGNRVHPVCADVLAAAHANPELLGCRFAMSDWLSDRQLRQAAAVWVVGASPSTACLQLAEESAMPVLSPEGRGSASGSRALELHYSDKESAGAGLRAILATRRADAGMEWAASAERITDALEELPGVRTDQ
jgi:glycosyltransferase involved in cell wall biosynthesis